MTPSNPTNSQPLIYRIADKLGVFHLVAPVNHTHSQSEIEGLSAALSGKQDALTFDTIPTEGSNNPVTSGGIKAALNQKAPANFVPTMIGRTVEGEGRAEVRLANPEERGVVIRFIVERNGEEEQSAEVNSENMANLLRALTDPDSTPTANSTNLVTSGGVKAAIDDVSKAVFGNVPYYITAAHEKMYVHTRILRNNTGASIRLTECIDVSTLPSAERANIYWNVPDMDIPNNAEIGIRFVRASNTIFLWYDGSFDY